MLHKFIRGAREPVLLIVAGLFGGYVLGPALPLPSMEYMSAHWGWIGDVARDLVIAIMVFGILYGFAQATFNRH